MTGGSWRAVAAGLALVLPAASVAQTVGVAAAVRNRVEIRSVRGAPPRPVAVRAPIAMANEVHTGALSQLQIVLLDRSALTIGAHARVTIDRYLYDPAPNRRTMRVTVARGAFRFLSGRRMGAGSSSVVTTPVAALGIRGTIVEGVVGPRAVAIMADEAVGRGVRSDPARATLIVLRGPGPLHEGDAPAGMVDLTAGGVTVTLDRPMTALYVPGPGMAPIGPFTLSGAGLLRVQGELLPPPLEAGAEGGVAESGGDAGAGEAGRGRRGGGWWILGALAGGVAGVVSLGSGGGGSQPAVSP
ncbi:MAG: FecR domain-containing protein [Pseudomonadota bacterium]